MVYEEEGVVQGGVGCGIGSDWIGVHGMRWGGVRWGGELGLDWMVSDWVFFYWIELDGMR